MHEPPRGVGFRPLWRFSNIHVSLLTRDRFVLRHADAALLPVFLSGSIPAALLSQQTAPTLSCPGLTHPNVVEVFEIESSDV